MGIAVADGVVLFAGTVGHQGAVGGVAQILIGVFFEQIVIVIHRADQFVMDAAGHLQLGSFSADIAQKSFRCVVEGVRLLSYHEYQKKLLFCT